VTASRTVLSDMLACWLVACDSVRDHGERVCVLTICDNSRGLQIFKKSRRHLKILDVGEVTRSKFRSEDPQFCIDLSRCVCTDTHFCTRGTNCSNCAANIRCWATWCAGFVNNRTTVYSRVCVFPIKFSRIKWMKWPRTSESFSVILQFGPNKLCTCQ
jgi:hypothetical protein